MDAKSRMNFINSVAGGEQIPCPQCGALNASGASVCSVCGAALRQSAAASAAPQPAAFPASPASAAEPKSAFALGLPSWDLTPPQAAIRRKKK